MKERGCRFSATASFHFGKTMLYPLHRAERDGDLPEKGRICYN